MPKTHRPRKGSLQYYPRKKASKIIPSVNWSAVSSPKSEGLLGFIVYKAGMGTAVVKDTTEKSMTQNKKIVVPVTILESPPMKIFSIRFYKNSVVSKDIIVSNDKDLKRKIRIPKSLQNFDSVVPKEFEDIRVIAYSLPKQASLKKTPDLIELSISSPNKLSFVKSLIGKEISISDFVKVVEENKLVDIRGVTKGKGIQGPVKRFGITLRQHKSEKGQRNPGSIGPWHPARVTFRTPLAGQLGFFSRVDYNHKIITSGKISEKDINPKSGFKHYGKVNSSFIIVKGSVQGPVKRPILLTYPQRLSKNQKKIKYEFQELII